VDRVGVTDVGGMRGGLQAPARQLRDEGIELALVAADDGDMRAEPRKQKRDRAPAPPEITATKSLSASGANTVGWIASSSSPRPGIA
jgi:hypothetical protein